MSWACYATTVETVNERHRTLGFCSYLYGIASFFNVGLWVSFPTRKKISVTAGIEPTLTERCTMNKADCSSILEQY